MSIYEKLDAALIANIKAGMRSTDELFSGLVSIWADSLINPKDGPKNIIIADRIQALRDAKKIVYSTKTGWAVVGEVAKRCVRVAV